MQKSRFITFKKRFEDHYDRWRNHRHIAHIAKQVSAHAPKNAHGQEVILFKASTGLIRFNLNTAFQMITAWSLELKGIPVTHFTCNAGMSRCVLGTDRHNPRSRPPCAACYRQTRHIQIEQNSHPFGYLKNEKLSLDLQDLDIETLSSLEYQDVPLGKLVLPSLRWIMRRHHLPDNAPYRFLFREYILSAWSVLSEFTRLLDKTNPRAVVVFNGMFYPEAIARWAALQRGIRVISHEVGLRQLSAFFTEGDATAYPIDIPESFTLSSQQNAQLDAYLEKRFKGEFTMAGIRFWPEMRSLDEEFQSVISKFTEIVPIFTNVVFDTSQTHANTVFPHMFAWLDQVLAIARHHPEILFIIRAHPDEMREGKQSQESVQNWANLNQIHTLNNVRFIGPQEYISSYELIQRSKFVMVYNSSIGLEAALMGKPVLCAGKARYTQYPIVYFPQDTQEYFNQAGEMLATKDIQVPVEFKENARRFLYYQLYRASLPFDEYLEDTRRPGFVMLKDFSWKKLLPENSTTVEAILHGLIDGRSFLLNE